MFPITLSLSSLSKRVSRNGGSLLFRFTDGQPRFFLIVWALAIGLAWLILALSVDDALLILGTRRAKTARQNCILVGRSDSHARQHELAALLSTPCPPQISKSVRGCLGLRDTAALDVDEDRLCGGPVRNTTGLSRVSCKSCHPF